MNAPRIGSLCSGFGGLDLAVEAVTGGRLAWVCEYEPPTEAVPNPGQGAAKVLAHRFPDVPNFGDITRIDWHQVAPIDILCAGFPCQDISHAGRRAGIKEGTRSGIWKHVADAIGVLRPGLVVLENVAAITVRRPGLDVVLADLAEIGFDARWTHLRASDIGAPHRRDRWFCVAWPAAHTPVVSQREPADAPVSVAGGGQAWPQPGGRSRAVADSRCHSRPQVHTHQPAAAGSHRNAAHTHGDGRTVVERRESGMEPRHDADRRRQVDWGIYTDAINRWEHITGRAAPAPAEDAPRGGRRLSARFVEWLMGLEPGWVTDVPGLTRTAQLTALGNGVVPQQAFTAIAWLTADLTVKETVS